MGRDLRARCFAVAGLALAALVLVGCSSSSSNSSTATPVRTAASTIGTPGVSGTPTSSGLPGSVTTISPLTTTPAAGTPTATTTIKTGTTTLGTVLTDSKGMTLYTYTKDVASSGQSTVSGNLATAWPPLTLTTGTPTKPAAVSGDLTLITRTDGSKQVAYKGLPLYYWQNDKAPGDVTGQNVAGFVIATP